MSERRDARGLLVLACFFLSGLAALVYQTAWTREFAFVFGTSDLAVATVLAAYMGGLALGAGLAARFVGRVRRPLLVYGLLELGIALAALAVPFAIQASRGLYVLAFGARGSPPSEGGLPGALFFLAASFAILLVPTALMGATLPLLARHAVREEREIGTRIGGLYAVNTLGAVLGTVLGAFVLLPALGLRGTVLVAVACNAAVFVAAAALARLAPLVPAAAQPAAGAAPAAALGDRRVLVLIALSGVASFAYEVLWTRLLTHVLGGSVYAFGTMLASFLVGIALGSAFAARRADTREAAARGFAAAQLGTAAASLLAFVLVDRLPALATRLEALLGVQLAVDVVLSALVLLPAALCIGATFPLAVRLAARGLEDAAAASARVYSWNTVGAIAGAVGTGFFVLPALGFAGTLALALGVNLVLAVASGLLAPPHARRLAVAAAGALLALAFVRPAPPENLLRSDPWTRTPVGGPIVHQSVGRSATVLLLEGPFGGWTLRTNGLQDADIPPPGARPAVYAVAHWLGLMPVLARPELASMLVVGLGGGIALEWIPPSVRTIDVVELEPEVIEANRAVAALRARDPLADPRVRLHVNDARGALLLMEGGLDAIVSQPSHPWTAGASHLYTREFFELVRDRLTDDGVFVQWMGLAFVDESLLRALIATLADVFPHVEVYQPGAMPAVLFVASQQPLDVAGDGPRAIAAAPEVFQPFGLESREDLLVARVLDDAAVRRLAEGAPIVRDDRNLLQMRSPWIRGAGLETPAARALFSRYESRTPLPADVDPLRVVRGLLLVGDGARARRVADAIADPAQRQGALGLIALAMGNPIPAGRDLDGAMRRDPAQPEVRAALLRLRKRALLQGGTPEAVGVPDASAVEQLVIEGWRLEAQGEWDALRALDARLAAVPAADPLASDATSLRVAWRVEAADPALAQEALPLLDASLARRVTPDDLVLRANAAVTAGRGQLALATLAELQQRLASVPSGGGNRWLVQRDRLAREALEVIERVEADDGTPGALLKRQFEALSAPRHAG